MNSSSLARRRRRFDAQRVAKLVRHGPIPAVVQAVWEEVYRSDLARTYEADIEWFDARAMGPDARVELWVGVE